MERTGRPLPCLSSGWLDGEHGFSRVSAAAAAREEGVRVPRAAATRRSWGAVPGLRFQVEFGPQLCDFLAQC